MREAKSWLKLARRLVALERRRPSQATLRRSVSTSYYALFHLLCGEYASLFAKKNLLKAAIARTVSHRAIADAARDFSKTQATLPRSIDAKLVAMPPELIELSKAFIRLQDERHDADYDLSLTYSRNEADAIVSLAEQAFKDWTAVRTTPAAAIFLACFQLKKAWDTER